MRGERLDWQMLIETALTAPGHMGDTYNRFYQYTFLNQLLLLMQGIREPIGTMKTWNALGRSVLKGSKAYQIVRPITIMKKNDEGEERRHSRGSSLSAAPSLIRRPPARSRHPPKCQGGTSTPRWKIWTSSWCRSGCSRAIPKECHAGGISLSIRLQ